MFSVLLALLPYACTSWWILDMFSVSPSSGVSPYPLENSRTCPQCLMIPNLILVLSGGF